MTLGTSAQFDLIVLFFCADQATFSLSSLTVPVTVWTNPLPLEPPRGRFLIGPCFALSVRTVAPEFALQKNPKNFLGSLLT